MKISDLLNLPSHPIDVDLRHVAAAELWHSGGGIVLDILILENGCALVVSADAVCLYTSAETFYAGDAPIGCLTFPEDT